MDNRSLLKLDHQDLLNLIDSQKRDEIITFIKELNRREYLVRFAKSHTFDSFKHVKGTEKKFQYGFMADDKAVPYFHPNRSFHDEIIWLNENLFYNPKATFEDKLINAAIVKFYGPSKTLEFITDGTGEKFVIYDKMINDCAYLKKICVNLENAAKRKEKIYGTTELRTSLQTSARNHARKVGTPIDSIEKISASLRSVRTCRTSDILFWFTELGPKFVSFYKTRPNMKESFEFLSSFRGIGNYYGYHFSSNLARMPDVGNLIFEGNPGNIDEDDDYVVPGVGAMDTINYFYSHLGHSINTKVGQRVINAIRRDQVNFFDLKNSDNSLFYMKEVSELGYFTNFGCEISCCQFAVYRRLKENKKLALKRAAAPISKEEVKMIINPKVLLERMGILKKNDSIPAEPIEDKKEENEIKNLDFNSTPKESEILSMIDSLGGNCSHSAIAKLIEEKNLNHYKQKSNWKESWVIMQELVKKGVLNKDGKNYRKTS